MALTERRLWHLVRNNALGLRFRRQYPVGPYTLDLYCPHAHLCVEVDGPHHRARRSRDSDRDEFLKNAGVRTLRFSTRAIIDSPDAVLRRIRSVALSRITPQR